MWRILLKGVFISLFLWIHFMSFPVFSAEPEPVLIGATVSLEGKYKEPSFMIRNGFKLWEKEVNQRGGTEPDPRNGPCCNHRRDKR